MKTLDLNSVKPKLEQWAERNPCILKLWIYGSYAKGIQTEESDLDIAIKISKMPHDTNVLATFICEGDNWRKQLCELLNFKKVHLELVDEDTAAIKQGLDENSILIYCDEDTQ